MGDLDVIDGFLAAFSQYIDTGFGLLQGDVAFLTTVLVGIDVTIAGLFWAMGGEDDVLGRLLKKILFVGAFALIIGNFQRLADIIFRSFAGLGLTAGGGGMTAEDLLRPGHLAGAGFEASWPLLDQANQMLGFATFFDNFLTIVILLIAWLFVIAAFFILSIQLFVTILEFKLTTLAGFVLVPFALWNRTSFLAERVLGSVVTSGVKVMVLAVIVGIGSGFFDEFSTALSGKEPDLAQAMSLVLASLSMMGLGIFGPGIASGLVSGAPQLGAGGAVATAAAGAGALALAGGGAAGAARTVAGGGLGALRAGTAMGGAATTAYRLGQETSGSPTVGAGLSGVASAASQGMRDKLGSASGLRDAAEGGERAALFAGARSPGSSAAQASVGDQTPGWARQLRSEAIGRHRRQMAVQTIRDGDRGGTGAVPDIAEKES